MMKRFLVETNAYNYVAFVDEEGNAYAVFDGQIVDYNGREIPLFFGDNRELNMTIAMLRNDADFSAIEDCETAEDINNAIGTNVADHVFEWAVLENEASNSWVF